MASFTPSICFVVPDIFKSILLDVPKIAFSLWKSQKSIAPILINSPKFFLIFCKSSSPTSYISSYIGSSSNLIFSFKLIISSFFEYPFFEQCSHLYSFLIESSPFFLAHFLWKNFPQILQSMIESLCLQCSLHISQFKLPFNFFLFWSVEIPKYPLQLGAPHKHFWYLVLHRSKS